MRENKNSIHDKSISHCGSCLEVWNLCVNFICKNIVLRDPFSALNCSFKIRFGAEPGNVCWIRAGVFLNELFAAGTYIYKQVG